MNYEEAEAYLKKVSKSGVKPGLDRMRELCRRLGSPEKKLSFIHVAGTNGKGSVAAYISSILAVGGHLAGRYVSPAVFCREEFIQFEDMTGICYIDRELFAQVATEAADAADSMRADGLEPPTLFEMETAMAFLAFVRRRCSVVILEAGLGGTEDATNIIENVIASVITPISRDHQAFLGNTLEEIAGHKAGIIKKNGFVSTCQTESAVCRVLEERAKRQGVPLIKAEREDIHILSADLDGTVFSYRGENYRTAMPGLYQVENACLAVETCRHLPEPFALQEEQWMLGIRRAHWRGRFEVVRADPPVILDGAHNPAGARALAGSVGELLPGKTLHAVMGVLADKDYEKMVEILAPVFSDAVLVTPPSDRALDGELLARVWRKNGCRKVSVAADVRAAIDEVSAACRDDEGILVFGSLTLFRDLPRGFER